MSEYWRGSSPGHRQGVAGRTRPGRSMRSRWSRLRTRGKIGYTTVTVVTSLAVLISLGLYGIYLKLDGNISVVNPFAGLRHRPPASSPGVVNILILGSQTRDGQGPGFGYDPGTKLSDNLILVHLDASHTHATIVSIPRDTMIYEPACKSRFGDGTVPAMPQAIIDGAMNLGGPSCAVATVEHLTDIRMDHFVEFDFNSFRAMVDTVGGVEACIPQAYNDPWSRLHLAKGRHLITGNQALAFVRTRHGVGNGGDLGRIELQQEFFSSLIQKIESQGTLDNPVRLFDLANTATRAGHRGSRPRSDFPAALPGRDDAEPAYEERDLHHHADHRGSCQHQPAAPRRTAGRHALAPGADRRAVGRPRAGIPGLAGRAAASLRKLGFQLTYVGNAPATTTTTVSYPGSAQAGGADAVMNALGLAPAAQDGVSGPVSLTIGADFAGVRLPHRHSKHAQAETVSSPSGQQTIETRNAAANICSAMPAANTDVGTPP